MNGSIMGMTRTEISRKLDEIVDFAGIERYLDTPVKRYSSGMTVRLGFAVAAFMEPEILVVDEVLAVGDAEFQKKAIGKMQDVSQGGGRTVLFVSHNMTSVRHLCKNGVLLENGSVKYSGEINDVIDQYLLTTSVSDSVSLRNIERSIRGSETIRFSNYQFLDENDSEIVPRCGKYLKIRLFFDLSKDVVRNCRLSVGIWNIYGDPMISLPTDVTMEPFNITKEKQYVDCVIPRLPLTGGRYKLALSADSNGQMSDFINGDLKFEVADDDYYNQGRSIPSHLRGKIVLCNHFWNIND